MLIIWDCMQICMIYDIDVILKAWIMNVWWKFEILEMCSNVSLTQWLIMMFTAKEEDIRRDTWTEWWHGTQKDSTEETINQSQFCKICIIITIKRLWTDTEKICK